MEPAVAGPEGEAKKTRKGDVCRIVRADTYIHSLDEHVKNVRIDKLDFCVEDVHESLTSCHVGQSSPSHSDDEAARHFVPPERGSEEVSSSRDNEVTKG